MLIIDEGMPIPVISLRSRSMSPVPTPPLRSRCYGRLRINCQSFKATKRTSIVVGHRSGGDSMIVARLTRLPVDDAREGRAVQKGMGC